MGIHEKEQLLDELCDKYNLKWSYSWGVYYVSIYSISQTNGSRYIFEGRLSLKFTRVNLDKWDQNYLEATILDYILSECF